MATRYVTAGVTDLTTISLATGDSLVFMRGSQTIDAVNLVSAGITSLANIIVPPEFTGTIGSNGASIVVPVTGTVRYRGGGVFNYNPGASGTCARFVNAGSGTVNAGDGTYTKYEQGGGATNFTAGAIVVSFRQSGGTSYAAFCTTGTPGNNDFQDLRISGGTMTTERGLDNNLAAPRCIISGGSVNVGRVNASTNLPTFTGTATGGLMEIRGGTVNYQGGSIGTLDGDSGAINFGSLPASITITTPVFTRAFYNRSNFALPSGIAISYSTTPDVTCGASDDVY